MTTVHPIEAESYRILAQHLDLSALPPGPRAVIQRVIHASADLEFAESMIVPEEAVAAGVAAVRAGAPIVTDVEMTRVAITGAPARCYLAEADAEAEVAADPAAEVGAGPAAADPEADAEVGADPNADPEAGAEGAGRRTRSAAAMRLAAARHPGGAVFVIGCAPTALEEVLALTAAGRLTPALVIGLPVGFVGAAAAKEAARASGIPVISNKGEKGGAGVAAAACNAIVRLAHA